MIARKANPLSLNAGDANTAFPTNGLDPPRRRK